MLGAEQVARSEADGYTLLTATSSTLAINKALYRKLPYDPVADFTAIAPVARVPFALVVNPSLPAKTLAEFIAYAKANPGLAYGSAGNGSPHHLGAEMLRNDLESTSITCPIAAAFRRCLTSSRAALPSWWRTSSRRCRKSARER